MFQNNIHNKSKKIALLIGLFFVLCIFLITKLSNVSAYYQYVYLKPNTINSAQKFDRKIKLGRVTSFHKFKLNPIFKNHLTLENEIIFENLIEDSENDPDDDFVPHLNKAKPFLIQKLIIDCCIKKSWALFNTHKSIKSLNLLFVFLEFSSLF